MTGFGYNVNGFGSGSGGLAPYNADFLVVAGGGGGMTGSNAGRAGGGGAAGGFRTFTCQELTAGENYAVVIGAGGAVNTKGGNSSIVGTGICIASAGGGRGGGAYEKLAPIGSNDDCMDGGSGGGGGGANAFIYSPVGGCGNSPPTSPSQGNNGGGGGGADCFIAGTQVMMHDHSLKNIENVQVGDKVHRYDAESNEVLELQNNITTGGRKLGSINGGEHFFTEDHPLKTPSGWKSINSEMSNSKYDIGEIGQLQIGDTIIGHAGDDTIITSIETKEVSEDTYIYNFALDGDHEYFANGFLVHNKGGGGGGGGGAGAVGGNGVDNGSGGGGGAGSANAFSTGSNITYAAGGTGGNTSGGSGSAGTANLGNGGGGSPEGSAAAAGSGFVVIRYDTSQAGAAGAAGGNATATYCSGCTAYKVHRFTASGCYTAQEYRMAHFALLDENNKVLDIIVVGNEHLLDKDGNESEAHGKSWCEKFWHRRTGDVGSNWIQTSYNTRGGKHYQSDGSLSSDQSKALRVNSAFINGHYDSTKDAFIPPLIFKGWVLNETTCNYEPPTEDPTTGTDVYEWDNDSEDWVRKY